MSTPPHPPGYGTLPPDPDGQQQGPYPVGQNPGQSSGQPYPGTPPQYGQQVPPQYGQQAPGMPGPYGQQPAPFGAQPANSTVKTVGIVSLVAGIIGLPAACCCWFIGWIPALVALGTGVYGLTQVKDDPSQADSKPFLIIGIVLGALGLLLVLASAVWGVASFASDYNDF